MSHTKFFINLNTFVFLLTLFCAILFSNTSFSQRLSLPIYSDYLTDNYYLVHPSMAGASNFNKVRLTARKQWFDIDNAPNLQTLSLNGRINENVGLGGVIYSDSNGRFSQQGAQATFAYHLMFSRSTVDINQLSFGLSAGIIQDRLDQSDLLTSPGIPDPGIDGSQLSETFFNVDVGISYFFINFFAHVTFKNLLPQKHTIFTDVFEIDNQRQYLASMGYTINRLGSRWVFEPSVFYQHREALSQTNIDFNAKAYYQLEAGQFWGGISYRRALDGLKFIDSGSSEQTEYLQYISPFIGFNYNKFTVAYTYSHQAFSEVISTSGFHQITLGYNFGENRQRQRCICPAINY